MPGTVGIIANPTSGKDIRRIVALGSVSDNHEKISILARLFTGLEAFSVSKIMALGDAFGLVVQAYEKSKVKIPLELSTIPLENSAIDSYLAAKWMKDAAVDCIVTLGGDGTNRIVSKGCAQIPLLPISTGTNNVFPQMMESTLVGIAAAAIANKVPGIQDAIQRKRRLEVYKNGNLIDISLIDVVVFDEVFRGSGALWEIEKVVCVILAEQHPAAIGAASIANSLLCPPEHQHSGLSIEIGKTGNQVQAVFGPGLILPITIENVRWLIPGQPVHIPPIVATLALDGERDIMINPRDHYEVVISTNGPRVINMERALEIARINGFFNITGGQRINIRHYETTIQRDQVNKLNISSR